MDEALSQFSAIASVSAQVAEHYLEACNWNLETALFQYLENAKDEGPMDALPQHMPGEGDITAQDIEDMDCNPSPRVSPTGSERAVNYEEFGNDHELQRALEASMAVQGSGSRPIEVDMESPRIYGSPNRSHSQSRYHEMHQATTDEPPLAVEGHAILPSQNHPPPDNVDEFHQTSDWANSSAAEFPPDVDLEEARMYEAAHFGIPYHGQIPRFSPPRSPSPETIARRVMVSTQDQEYDESLKTDREKAMAAQMAESKAREVEWKRKEQQMAALHAMEEEQKKLQKMIQDKKSNLPPEPSESAPTTISLIIRLPDGLKLSRRFDISTPLQVLFDFVDVEVDGKGDLTPGSYNLVRQFPRTVYAPGDVKGSLEAGGFTNNEALFAMKRT